MPQIKILPAELQKVAETELGEVPARVDSDLLALKTWIEQAPHLKARLDDQFLIQFLRGCKYSLEKAKTKIDLFFTLKTKFPELFNVVDINEAKFKNIQNYGFCVPLPQPLTDNGPRILFMSFDGDIGKGVNNIEDLFRMMSALQETMVMNDPYACINGLVYIVDLKNITLNMASQFTPGLLRKTSQFYEKSLPFRIKSVHMLNMPGFFQAVLTILLPLLSEKLRQRIYVYGQNNDKMPKDIPTKYLPTHLGGENGCLEQLVQDFDKKLLEYENYFQENANYGTNEQLRPGKPIDFDSMYGLGGSFRKIDVD